MKICAPFLLFIRKIFVPLAQEINLKTSRSPQEVSMRTEEYFET